MMKLVSEVEAAPTMNPSALSGVRFLVTKRIEELDASASALDDELAASPRACRSFGPSRAPPRHAGERC